VPRISRTARSLTLALAAMLVVGVAPAAAKTRAVDDDGRQCWTAQYTSVQAAVDAAQPGELVLMCAGT